MQPSFSSIFLLFGGKIITETFRKIFPKDMKSSWSWFEIMIKTHSEIYCCNNY